MTLLQIILFLAGLAAMIYFTRFIIVELGFPGSLIEALKPYECEFCKKKYWNSRKAFDCCKGTLGYDLRARRIEAYKKSQGKQGQKRTTVGLTTEHDCPNCNGKPGNYTCPLCEGRGKTFIW